MAYLTTSDYLLQIQDVNLQQIINSNEAIRDQANLLAVAEARSFLISKYNIDTELAKTGSARDPQLLSKIVDIALYHLHQRIAPRNIPELRVNNYMGLPEHATVVQGKVRYPMHSALGWLQACVDGTDITPNLTLLVDADGNKLGNQIRSGGNKKNINSY